MAISKSKVSGGFVSKLMNNIEKVVLGLVVLIAIFLLGMTSWTPIAKDPVELLDNVKKAKDNLKASVLPQEKRDEYSKSLADNTTLRVQNSFNSVTVAGYEWINRLINPPVADNNPIKEPVWFPVERLIATPGKAVLAQLKATPKEIEIASAAGDSKTAMPEKKDTSADDFKPRTGPSTGTTPGGPDMIPVDPVDHTQVDQCLVVLVDPIHLDLSLLQM